MFCQVATAKLLSTSQQFLLSAGNKVFYVNSGPIAILEMHAPMWIKQYLKDIENLSVILVGSNRIGGVMVSVLASSAVDHGFGSNQRL